MTFKTRISRLVLIGVAAFAFAGCATHYDRKSTNTMLGTGLGAATGAVVSQGNPWMTLGGAAAGGILGNILTEDRDQRRPSRGWNHNNRKSSHHVRGHDHRRHDDRRPRRHR